MKSLFGVSERTISRYESGQNPIPHDLFPVICEVTGVPMWFFDLGFSVTPNADEPSLVERVEALEHQIATLMRQLGDRIDLER